ncbi:MAG: MFS transporter [Thermomicrobiales bacterium]|nr:MFS transporter [Thermomicrobiales bacterium]
MSRSRLFYGWWIVAALSITEPVSWGILYYAFSVFIEPTSAELGWSRNQLTAAFSLALIASGIAAVPFGRWLDRHGPRWLMTIGSAASALLIVAWSRVESYPVFVAVWLGLGVCMAATFYEPAFAAVTTWFRTYRSRALTLLTFGGGFASVIFIPLSAWLVHQRGWRDALVILAVLLAIVTIPIHAGVLRRDPAAIGACPDGDCGSKAIAASGMRRGAMTLRDALRSRSFRWLSLAFGLVMFANVATTVLLIPLLIDRGESARFAASAAAAIGLLALPGRLIFTPLGDWLPPWAVPGTIFLTQAAGLVVLAATSSHTGIWCFVLLFGIGFGAITPARASLGAELYGVAAFGSISGVLALIVTFSRAAGPFGGSLIASETHGDRPLLIALALLSVAAAISVYLATIAAARADGDTERREATTPSHSG